MLLHRLIDAVRDHLTATLPAGTKVSAALPRLADDLPAVVLSVDAAEPLRAGVGGPPKGSTTGALEIHEAVDLADPVLRSGDATVTLLSKDRMRLQLPHGGLVDSHGGDSGPLPLDAVTLTRGTVTYAVVDGVPAPHTTQAQVDRTTGIVRFGEPLPDDGTLDASYFVGRSGVDTYHFRATLHADVFGSDDADVEDLSRRLATAMATHTVVGLSQVAPLVWGPVAAAEAPGRNTLHRLQSWRCRFEYDDVRVLSGGGPIRDVRVKLSPRPGATPTEFSAVLP